MLQPIGFVYGPDDPPEDYASITSSSSEESINIDEENNEYTNMPEAQEDTDTISSSTSTSDGMEHALRVASRPSETRTTRVRRSLSFSQEPADELLTVPETNDTLFQHDGSHAMAIPDQDEETHDDERSINTPNQQEIRIILLGPDGSWYCHLLRAGRLSLLATGISEFARAGLRWDDSVHAQLLPRWMPPRPRDETADVDQVERDAHCSMTIWNGYYPIPDWNARVALLWWALCSPRNDETVGDPGWTLRIHLLAARRAGETCRLPGADGSVFRITVASSVTLIAANPAAARCLDLNLRADGRIGRWAPVAIAIQECGPTPPGLDTGPLWIVATEEGSILAVWTSSGKHVRLAGSTAELGGRGLSALWGHRTYVMPGCFLPGETWPLCRHIKINEVSNTLQIANTANRSHSPGAPPPNWFREGADTSRAARMSTRSRRTIFRQPRIRAPLPAPCL